MLEEIKRRLWLPRNDIDLPSKGILCHWVRDVDEDGVVGDVVINEEKFVELLKLVPDKVAENLLKARDVRAGRLAMLKAGGGSYQELLSAIIVDGTAIASSSAEAKLAPTLKIGANYMQPGGLPGKTLRITARGRVTTLTTQATMTFRFRIAGTDIITGTIIMASGGITQDATVQTNTMWNVKGDIVVRSVGSTGTVFGMGDSEMATAAATVAAQTARFMGSAGSATPAAATWDMNSDQFFQFTGQWSLATAYSIQTHDYMLESLN